MSSTKQPLISFIIPVYNESTNLTWHHTVITDFMAALPYGYELIYIDDGSSDNSAEIIKKLSRHDPHSHYILLSRNFGKEAALTAGLRKAKGDAVIAMDSDGQHPMDVIPAFIKEWQNGSEVVVGVRGDNPSETYLRTLGSRAFYRMLRFLDGTQEVVAKSTDFRLLDRKVVDAFNELTERNRVTRNLIDWLGFRRSYVAFHALERHDGVASYDFSKKVKLALDGMIKHTTKPLKLIGGIGVIISVLSAVAATGLFIENYLLGDPLNLSITGTAILALLLSFLVGIVLVCQGMLALYLENVYHETQNRPLFVISDES